MDFSMAINVPMKEVNAGEIVQTIVRMGAANIGGYGIKDKRFIKGARYEGGNLVKMGELYFLIVWDEKNSKITLKHIEITDQHVMASEMPVVITTASNMKGSNLSEIEKVMFACKEDAIEWLNTKQKVEIMNCSVTAPDYRGSALMYMYE